MSTHERVRVAVRVRPLNTTERLNGHQNIIQIDQSKGNALTIWDPIGLEALDREEFRDIDPSCWARQFIFDHCLYSLEGEDLYQSQESVFQTIGQPVVNWALDGYNSCVFAYGQTGAGKSFTMMGTDNPAEFGLIPRICFGLFEYLDSVNQDSENQSIVEFSYLEIYNESLRDCLTNSAKNLKVRESPREGTFVTNLTVIQVSSFEDILSLLTTGNSHRSVASTRSNLYSSRSHAIVTLTVRQRYREAPKDGLLTSALRSKVSKIHLVDLAGSERVTNSGAVGIRLREANNINKSLSVLGDVIKSLGENSRNRTTAGHIPYRNSILTMVLKNSLGGNSRTVMVANVSPSSVDYEETISTLKYADNTKKIRLRVEANVISGLSASDGGAMQLVPVLQAEVKKLRELLQQQQIQQHKFTQSSHLNSGVSSVEMNNETLDLVDQMRARVVELEEQLMEREELIKNLMENSSVAPLNNEDEDSMSVITTHSTHTTATSHSLTSGHRSQPYVVLADDAIDTTLPRLINLNQDPLFSECLVYYIPHGQAIAGSSEADVDILLSGPDILAKHCCLHNDHDDVYIYPMSSTAKIYVNGLLLQQPVSKSTERYYLRHFDRVSMGKYHLFRFEACGRRRAVSPVKGMKSTPLQLTTLNTDAPGWDFAHDELMLYKDSTKLAPRSRSPRRGDTSGQFPPGYFTSIMNVVDLDSPNKISSAPKNHQVTSSRNIDLETYQEDIISLNETKPLTQRSPSDDWWDKVHQVVDNPTKVNTPAELRAMLRSVMESAEKQFDNAFSSIKTDTIEKKNQSEEEKTFKISPQISKSSDTEIPPPPPLLSTQRHSTPSDYLFNLSKGKDQQMSTQSQVSAIKLPTKIKLPSNDTKTVDILYAERKSLSSYVISQPESGIIHEDESSKIKTRNSLSSDAQLSTGSNTGGGHRYNSQKVDRIASSSTILFEDEASALQKDMLQMQQSLRERIQRYK